MSDKPKITLAFAKVPNVQITEIVEIEPQPLRDEVSLTFAEDGTVHASCTPRPGEFKFTMIFGADPGEFGWPASRDRNFNPDHPR